MINALLLRFGFPLAAWALFFHESITDMVGVWGQSKTYEHGYLIVPICLWLVWQEKDRFQTERLSTTWLPAALLVVPGLLWLIGNTAGIALFEHVAAVISLQLIIWALIGHSVAKTFYFPILYLFFCIPFGEELVPYLQSITADLSVAMVKLSDIPIYREGMYLYIPNGQFEVAEACSGIRFLISSIALGSLFGYLFFNKTWKLIAFVAFSCVLPIIANSLRAYGIILVGHLSNMEHATGADHLVYGWVFFSIVTIINFFIAYILKDKFELDAVHSKSPNTRTSKRKTIAVSLSILLILAGFKLWEVSVHTQKQPVTSAPLVPQTLTHQNMTVIEHSEWGISFPNAQDAVRSVALDGKTEIFSARYIINQQNGELISQDNQLFDKNTWSIIEKENLNVSPVSTNQFDATQLSLVNIHGDRMTVLYWYCIDNYCSNNKLKLKLQKASRLLSGKTGYSEVRALASVNSSESKLIELAQVWMTQNTNRNQ